MKNNLHNDLKIWYNKCATTTHSSSCTSIIQNILQILKKVNNFNYPKELPQPLTKSSKNLAGGGQHTSKSTFPPTTQPSFIYI